MNISSILQLSSTVFTIPEIVQSIPGSTHDNVASLLSHAVKTHTLLRLSRGVYAKLQYDPYEYANKRYTPSYVSFETMLRVFGMIFQYSDAIQCASYVTRTCTTDPVIQYFRLPDTILTNPSGIYYERGIAKATKERAWLDTIYLWKSYHCDTLQPLDWNVIDTLLPFYTSVILTKRVKHIRKEREYEQK